MKRICTHYYIPFLLLALLLAPVSAGAQDSPSRIQISWLDTSHFPQIEVHLIASKPTGGRFQGLFVNSLQVTENGTARDPSMYDAPRGTAITFLIDADQKAQAEWDQIRQGIESYVSATESWMDEDLDVTTLIVANGGDWRVLVQDTPFRNDVLNAFITDTGAYYQPTFHPVTPLYDLAYQALQGMPAKTPTPGMYRALVLLSSGDPGASTSSPEAVVSLAKEMGVPLFAVLVGDSAAGETIMQQLASNSGGQFLRLDPSQTLVPLWQALSSHHEQYVISYRSGIVSSGAHNVKVLVSEGVQDTQAFDITILNPGVEITLPEANATILRKPTESSADVSGFEPSIQAVKYLWTWPDGFERKVNQVQLRVNGAVQLQLDLTATDDRSLTWDISTLPSGRYSIRVEVTDELGLTGVSAEIPVTIQLQTSEPTVAPEPTAQPTPGPSFVDNALKTAKKNLPWIGAGGLSLSALLVTFFMFKRRLAFAGKTPVGFLRSLPFLRPLDRALRTIERVTGPIGVPKPKKPDVKAPARAKSSGAAVEKTPAAPAARVEVTQGPSLPGPVEIIEETSFGRSAEQAGVALVDATVSRRHASILPEFGGKYRIYNHSPQQTWVNEQRVPEHGLLLEDGDEIRMGKVKMKFVHRRR